MYSIGPFFFKNSNLTEFPDFKKLKFKFFSINNSRMRSLLNSESNSRFSSKSALEGPGTQSFSYERPTPGQSLQIKREDLSPVSKFRQENSQATRPGNTNKQYLTPRFITRPKPKEPYQFSSPASQYSYEQDEQVIRRQPNPKAYEQPLRYKTSRFSSDYDNYKTSSNRAYEPSTKRFSNIPSNKFSNYEPNKSRYAPNFRIEYSDNEDDKVY